MDYQEAIKEAEIQIDMYESMILYNKDFEPKNDNSNYERKIDFLKTSISAMREMQEYRQKLNNTYGECDDILRTVVDRLARHEGIEFGTPIKSRLLTDEDVDLWKVYKQLGTLDEVREAMERKRAKKIKIWNGQAMCPSCSKLFGNIHYIKKLIAWEMPYCKFCGQAIDWSDGE